MGLTCEPHRGPVGPDNVGPTRRPHLWDPLWTHGTHKWDPPYVSPRIQLYVGPTIVFQKNPLNSDKINPHSTYVAPHKTLYALVKLICTPRTTNLQKTPQDFCKTNPLNVYWWRVKSPHTFTHCIYHNIDTYDDCHIQAFSLRTHRQSGDVNLVKTPWTFSEINPQSMDGNFTKKKPPVFVNVYKRPPELQQNWHTLYWWQLYEKKNLILGETNLHSTNIKFTEKSPRVLRNQPP